MLDTNHPLLNKVNAFFKKKPFLLTILLFVSQIPCFNSLYAQGVAAGTTITNTVIVNYKIDGVQQAPLESSPTGNSVSGIGKGEATVFKVDRKIDLLLTGNTHANVISGEPQAEVTYTLTNEGNDSQEFSFLLDTALQSDDFDTTNCLSVVTSITGTPLSGVSTPTSGNIKLKADQQASISVKCDIPLNYAGQPLLTGQTSLLSLYATAEKNSDDSPVQESTTADTAMGIETVYADSAGSDDGNRDASHSARRTYTVSTNLQSPTAVNDTSTENTAGNTVTLNPLDNDTGSNASNTLNPSSVLLTGTGVSTDGKTLTIAGEGIWTVNLITGEVTFTPDSGFTGNPSSISYTVKDNDGNTSNQATIRIDYKQIAAPSTLIINKSIVNTVDANGGNKAASGAEITYKITITTTGQVNDIVITDPTPIGMTYKTGSITLNNNPLTDDSDADKADFGITYTNTATIDLGDISAGSQDEILLSYIIN